MAPLTAASQLRSSLLVRADSFADRIERQLAEMGSSGPGLRHALELFQAYAEAMRRQVQSEYASLPTRLLEPTLRALRTHLNDRIALFDDRFGRPHPAVPSALTAAVEQECDAMGLTDREAVLTVGPPGNFVTLVADLRRVLFQDLTIAADLPDRLIDLNLVLVAVPEHEGTRTAWQPITVGHEVCHYLQVHRSLASSIPVVETLDPVVLNSLHEQLPQTVRRAATPIRGFTQVALFWLSELLCDAYATHRYGAAGVAALSEYLDWVGATDLVADSHPPARLRQGLMSRWLGETKPWEEEILGPFTSPNRLVGDDMPDWVKYLSGVFESLSDSIFSTTSAWSRRPPYQSLDRGAVVEQLAGHLVEGRPCEEQGRLGGQVTSTLPADVVNACWLALARGTDKPVDRLASKSLDTLDFLRLWRDAGGDVAEEERPAGFTYRTGTLSATALAQRLASFGDDRVVMTPRPVGPLRGASLDVRLGNGFIVFERTAAPAFDALDVKTSPRSMQRFVQKAWGDVFHLHPGELVLASTLEYIVLPDDLNAQVVTRSSYGRLGLISATAIQVHPRFAGCLTLELVNLGEVPLTITPGERIAQLVFTTTTHHEPAQLHEKYRFPTGPEFSKVRDDEETKIMREVRRRWITRRR